MDKDLRAEAVSRHALAVVGALGVIVAEVSTARLWPTAVDGLAVLAVDVALLAAVLVGLWAGRRLASSSRQLAAAGRSGPFGLLVSVAAVAGGLIGAGSVWLALQPVTVLAASAPATVGPAAGPAISGAASAGESCGSLLVPGGGFCGTLPGAGSVVVTGVLAVALGGLVLGYLGAAAGVGPGITVATWPKFAFWAAGVLLVGSLVIVPRSVDPAPAGPGAGTTGASAVGSIASEVGGDLRLAVALLVGALALLAAIGVARRRPDGRMPLTVLPVALATSAVAGVAVAVVWQAVVWSGLSGG